MYCRKCGTQLIEDSNFCTKCGTEVVAAESGREDPEKDQPKTESAKGGVAVAPASEGKVKVSFPDGEARSSKPESQQEKKPDRDDVPLMFPPEGTDAGKASSTGTPPRSALKADSSGMAMKRPSKPPPEEKEGETRKPAGLPEHLLPRPTGFAKPDELEQVEAKRRERNRKKKKEQRRWHPLDAYEPIRQRLRMGGCFFSVLLVILVPLIAIGFYAWLQHHHFVGKLGFESVVEESTNIVEAPEDDTIFWGKNVLYEVDETGSEVAFAGGTWWLGGTFREKVYFRGYELILEDGARFEKGIDVSAVKFDPGEAVIDGELSGRIFIQE